MKNTDIVFRCIEKGKMRENKVNREDLLTVFEGLVKGFHDDNAISKELVKFIPGVDVIVVNKDINSTKDIPFIALLGKDEKAQKEDVRYIINIMRRHTIVWSIINKYCE